MEDPELDLAEIWRDAFMGWHQKQEEEEKLNRVYALPHQECKHERYEHYSEGTIVCVKCGEELSSFVPQRLEYIPEGHRRIPVYRRIHHFNERMSQWLCMDSAPPMAIMQFCKDEIKAPVTKTKIRAALRKAKGQKYIEKWIHIYCFITQHPAPSVCSFKLQRIRELFPYVETAFLSHKPPTRKSIISYNYIFVRLLQMLEMQDQFKWFPLLKSRVKLQCINGIWRNMCTTIGIEYTDLPTFKSLR
jgi:hypothetical protein